MRLVDVDQMTEADARARARIGDVAIMREAGRVIALGIRQLRPDLRSAVAFAGPGNNGGDAFAAFAELDGSIERTIFALPAQSVGPGRRDAEIRARVAGVQVVTVPEDLAPVVARFAAADIVLDALLGIGARPDPSVAMRRIIGAINAAARYVLAIDVPTGVDGSSGAVSDCTVRAAATITVGAVKLGLTLDPARDFVGELYVGDLGLAAERDALPQPRYEMLTADEFAALVPKRPANADKRSSGAPLVIAGSEQFPGAAVLCARGAARAGAGYVTIAVPEHAAMSVRSHLIEQVVVTYDPADVKRSVDTLDDLVTRGGSVAIGPGLGLDDGTGEIVRRLIERLEVPFVADASAFFHLTKNLEIIRGKRCVLTPHEREFGRLSGEGTVAPGTRVPRLRAFVNRTGVTTLLKGRATLIDDGTTLHVNPTGTAALATAGTGDVLTGMIATLLAQGLAPVDAARVAAFWHGRAGQAAQRDRPIGVLAGDVAEHLGAASIVAEPAPSVIQRML